MDSLRNLPGMTWIVRHPRLTAWFVLSLGMVILLLIEARDVGLTATNWLALIIATVLVAGLCVWIISWEDSNVDDEDITPATDPPRASESLTTTTEREATATEQSTAE